MTFRIVPTVAVVAYVLLFLLLAPTRLSVPPEETFSHDAGDYSRAAVSLVQSGRYSLDGVHPTLEREPGYSVFLALLYLLFGVENRSAIFAAQGALTLGAALFLHRELRRAGLQRVADRTLALLLLLPSLHHTIFSAYRENFALTLAMISASLLLRLLRAPSLPLAAGAGVLLGALILTYIPFLFFPVFLLLAAVFFRPFASIRKHCMLLALAAVLVVALWGLRNVAHTGRFQIAAPERAVVVRYVRGEQAEHLRGLDPFRCLLAEYITRNWTGLPQECSYNALMHQLFAREDFPERAAAIAREGERTILQNLPHYLWFSLFEVLELHLPFVNGWGFVYNILAAVSTVVLLVGFCFSFPFLFRKEYAPFFLLLLYGAIIFALTDATPRYLVPLLFCYSVLAAVGYDRLFERLRVA